MNLENESLWIVSNCEGLSDWWVIQRTDAEARPRRRMSETHTEKSEIRLRRSLCSQAFFFSRRTASGNKKKTEKSRKHVDPQAMCHPSSSTNYTINAKAHAFVVLTRPDGWHLVVHAVPWPLMLRDRLLTFHGKYITWPSQQRTSRHSKSATLPNQRVFL